MKGKSRFLCSALCTFLCGHASAQTAPKLLPFQGRLTDAAGTVVADGAKVVQFKIYNAPVGGQAVWNGEVQKLTVNGGLVNTVLGSKTSLAGVDFNQSIYLELTLDANNDGQITLADPPLLPRQSILPAVFSKEAADSRDSRKLAGEDWTPVFGVNSPTGPIMASKLADGSIPGAKIQANTITSNQIAPGSITSNQIANGSIDLSDLVQQVAEALVPPGTIVAFGGTIVPSGWLLCAGQSLSSAQYPRLYLAISTNWGGGVLGTTNNFSVPDLRGIFLRGIDVTGLRDSDVGLRTNVLIGGNFGNKVGSYQFDAMQGHNHALYYLNYTAQGSSSSGVVIRGTADEAQNTNGPTKAVKEPTTDNTHGAPRVSNETRPINAYVNYIIKY